MTVRLEPDGLMLVSSRLVDGSSHEFLEEGEGDPLPPRQLCGDAVRLRFEGCGEAVQPVPEQPLPGLNHFFLGRDSSRWQRNVMAHASVLYRGIHPGIDVRVRDAGGLLEYDVLLAPGADPSSLVMSCEGHEELSIDADGRLLIRSRNGVFVQPVPVTWEVLPAGERRKLSCRYRLVAGSRFGFDVEGRDPALAAVIDPVVQWASFLGGTSSDVGGKVAVGPDGTVTTLAVTRSPDFPVTPGSFDTILDGSGELDIAITRFAADGASLVFSSFLGGSGFDGFSALVVAPDGASILSGLTKSPDFPVTARAYDQSFAGTELSADGYVAKVSADGSDLLFATYLGGSLGETMTGLKLTESGSIVVCGSTGSPDFPATAGAFDTVKDGTNDAFVTALTPDGSSLQFSTFVGGMVSGTDVFVSVDEAQDGTFLLCGQSSTIDFPLTMDATEPVGNGQGHYTGLVAKLSADGADLLYASYFGPTFAPDNLFTTEIRESPDGSVLLFGDIRLDGLPMTAGSFQPAKKSIPFSADLFVARLDRSLKTILKATYLGGTGPDIPQVMELDGAGRVYVGGQTKTADFPVTPDAFDSAYGFQCADGSVAVLDATLSTLLYGSYIGNSTNGCTDVMSVAPDACGGLAIAVDEAGPFWTATVGAFDTTWAGSSDAWVARLQVLEPWSSLSGGVEGTLGPMQLLGGGCPCAGEILSVTLHNALPLAHAFLVLGTTSIEAPFKGGVFVPSLDFVLGGLATGAGGELVLQSVWPPGAPSGLAVFVQAWVKDEGAVQGFAGSTALRLETY
jgi:hypothetical protein